ncbi:ras-related protein Rab-40C isoform X3 [Pan troglodytes]|uniref:ras-related protein Rab-40C isoform X3 n=1 Tax=Pan troglodytes TaxID=9598 RepID=UPI000511FFAA|nr:ras-related protein Rab-40C isoform X3 [Pan troglodytes]
MHTKDRLQDHHHPAGRPAREAGALGHVGPGPVLHHLQVLLQGRSALSQVLPGGFTDGLAERTLSFHSCTSPGCQNPASACPGNFHRLMAPGEGGEAAFLTPWKAPTPLLQSCQGILLVYDITNRWSFDGIDRWIKEIDEHAPGVPRILVGNRLHLAFKRQVPTEQARAYAEKNCMTFFEVSPLCNFNVIESFTELSRIVLMRHGMEKIWRPNRVFSLQDLCCRAIVSCTPVHLIDKLPLPVTIKSHLKSFSMANGMNAVMMHGRSYSLASGAGGGGSKGNSLKRSKSIRPPQSPPQNCSRSNCKIS